MIVPAAAGSSNDTVGRIVAERMRKSLVQPIIIENIGGADGSIAAGRTARAKPDGYTIDLIRVTGKRYKTQQGISVGSTLDQIKKAFPDAAPIDTIPTVYDASKEGIAFEFEKTPAASSVCIAIMVHPPGGGQIATQENVAAVMEEHGKN